MGDFSTIAGKKYAQHENNVRKRAIALMMFFMEHPRGFTVHEVVEKVGLKRRTADQWLHLFKDAGFLERDWPVRTYPARWSIAWEPMKKIWHATDRLGERGLGEDSDST